MGNYQTCRNKHDILSSLIQTDGSVDGEKLMNKLSKGDGVNHPSYYNQGKIEVIDFIEDKKLGFNLGNACKYICRCQFKQNGAKRIQDLQKAVWYIQRQIYLWEKEEFNADKKN